MKFRDSGEDYRILEKIGEGGIAEVFLADDRIGKRRVALKIPRNENSGEAESIINEYRFMSNNRHPSILNPLNLIYLSDKPVLVAPFIGNQNPEDSGRIPKIKSDDPDGNRLLDEILAEILECANFIHFTGHYYNDFKPSNIFIIDTDDNKPRESRIKLIDFNLITARGDKPSKRGTLCYLAPEIIFGEKPGILSDIYSAGGALYELISGEPPFDLSRGSDIIHSILDTGSIDFDPIPERYRDGLSSMLSRDPGQRPGSLAEAARRLGLGELFLDLCKRRSEYYLASGHPPFAADLRHRFLEFRNGDSVKLLLIHGYPRINSTLDYLESENNISGFKSLRICAGEGSQKRKEILDFAGEINDGLTLFVDDFEDLDSEDIRKLKTIISAGENARMVAAGSRWIRPNFKYDIYDPLKHWTPSCATSESLKSYLKTDNTDFDCGRITENTGGIPEIIFWYLNDLSRSCDKIDGTLVDSILSKKDLPAVSEIERIYEKMVSGLSSCEIEVISMLSVWGRSIPLLILVKLKRDRLSAIEPLIERGFLIRGRESLRFLTGGLRDYIYYKIPPELRRQWHNTLAELSEELITDSRERLEYTALHWGLAENPERGYASNEEAAAEFYRTGDYAKARIFAERLLEFSKSRPESEARALKINADIQRSSGNFNSARKLYLKSMKKNPDAKLRVDINGELAKLNLTASEYKKSIYYGKLTLKNLTAADHRGTEFIFKNLLARAYWNNGNYHEAMETIGPDTGNSGNSETSNNNEDFYMRVFEISKESKNVNLEMLSLNSLGDYSHNAGDFKKACDYYSRALHSAEKSQNDDDIIFSLFRLGRSRFFSGELFLAIECFQSAREKAEYMGNIYFKAGAELDLARVSLEMGHYSLADKVLKDIFSDRIYNENRGLKLKADLCRLALSHSTGDFSYIIDNAERTIKSARVRGFHEISYTAEMILAATDGTSPDSDVISKLKSIYSGTVERGLNELSARASLLTAISHYRTGDRHNSMAWFENVFRIDGASKKTRLHAALFLAELQASRDNFSDSIENLIETESISAASGYLPLAMLSATFLADLYGSYSREDLRQSARHRAFGYYEKLKSALPPDISIEVFENGPYFPRYYYPHTVPRDNIISPAARGTETLRK